MNSPTNRGKGGQPCSKILCIVSLCIKQACMSTSGPAKAPVSPGEIKNWKNQNTLGPKNIPVKTPGLFAGIKGDSTFKKSL